ncbi:MAG: hypothetical protein LBV09_08505 [Deferribacteraceae bacterium]|jgi:hypothetical protein|nr:hypothetical protein [Deferribacteraceae bacterium]
MYTESLMRRLTTLTILALLLFAMAVEADFIDYRSLIRDVTPEEFESSISLSSQYPYSVTILSRVHALLWEATGVKDLHLSDGNPDAILQNDIVYLAENACGGIVSPVGGEMAFTSDDTLIVSTATKHYLYSISDCAQYNNIARYGDMLAVAETATPYLCEASPAERIVRDLNTGMELYRDTPNSHTVATYGDANGCYFIQRDGSVDKFTVRDEGLVPFTYVDDLVLSATAHDTGFAGFSRLGYFVMNVSEVGGVDVQYSAIPDGYCTDAEYSTEPICSTKLDSEVAEELFRSTKRATSADTIYLLADDTLSAYDKELSWRKEIAMTYELPAPCVDGDNLYFNDLFGEIFRVNIYDGKTLYSEADYPEYCDSGVVRYQDGAILMNNYMVYRFAEPLLTEGRRTVYKRVESADRVLYFIN